MKILIIDSHKGTKNTIPQNLHWQNAKILADYFQADLIWSYPSVNDHIKTDYDIIIFVHASHYAYTDYEWIKRNPNAKLFYITNEYNLGEPRTLWMAAKEGRKYTVIANHNHHISKVVMKYVNDWHVLNLNALSFSPQKEPLNSLISFNKENCVYYGSFRKGREKYFNKYLTKDVVLSTHNKNILKFKNCGVTSDITNRIDWNNRGIFDYAMSLYIEDVITHANYNFLANRFYEALNYNCVPIFSIECMNTVLLSGYEISKDYFITNSTEIKTKNELSICDKWLNMAHEEKQNVLKNIKNLLK